MEKRILIVEDDHDVHYMMKKRLKHHGYKCDSAYSVEEALEKIKKHNPDLVILDLGFKRANGTAFLKHAAEHLKTGDLPPVIVLSCYHEKDIVEYILDIGATGFLAKPYDPSRLLAMVSHFIHE